MKTVVLQTYTGKGFLAHGKVNCPRTIKLNKNIMGLCMKSVKQWCEKNDYEYKLLKEVDLGWDYFTKKNYLKNRKHNINKDREKDLCAQRHEIALDIEADYLIIMDNDIFIKEDFSLPKVKVGLCITPWGEYRSSNRKNYKMWERFEIFTQMYDDPYPQGGIQFINGKYIKHYNDWLVNSFKSTKWPVLWDGLEQSHIFAYSQNFRENIDWLDHKYNCIPKRYTKKEVKESFIIHFCGPEKHKQLHFLQEEILFKMFGETDADYLCKLWG